MDAQRHFVVRGFQRGGRLPFKLGNHPRGDRQPKQVAGHLLDLALAETVTARQRGQHRLQIGAETSRGDPRGETRTGGDVASGAGQAMEPVFVDQRLDLGQFGRLVAVAAGAAAVRADADDRVRFVDTEHRVADAALAQYAIELGEERVAGQRLKLYTSPAAIQREMQLTEAVFSDTVKLKGVWLAPRHDAQVVLVWQALVNQPPLDAKVFVHLIDHTGRIVAQQDGVPVKWTRPFRSWRQGEEVLDVYALPVPDGVNVNQLALRVGIYDPDTGARVPASDRSGVRMPDDAVLVPVAGAVPIEEPAK